MRCVYLIRNTINGKVYVGQTKRFVSRKAGHLYEARRGDKRPLYASMRKHGIDKFTFEILEECADELIDEREKHWVAYFDSFNPEKGYNLTSGGESGKEFSDESHEKIRQKALQRAPYSLEVRMRQGSRWRGKRHTILSALNAARTGSNNPMFGRTGERHPRAVLTQAQADEIRRRSNEPTKVLMQEFGVSKQTINRIKRNEIYL